MTCSYYLKGNFRSCTTLNFDIHLQLPFLTLSILSMCYYYCFFPLSHPLLLSIDLASSIPTLASPVKWDGCSWGEWCLFHCQSMGCLWLVFVVIWAWYKLGTIESFADMGSPGMYKHNLLWFMYCFPFTDCHLILLVLCISLLAWVWTLGAPEFIGFGTTPDFSGLGLPVQQWLHQCSGP